MGIQMEKKKVFQDALKYKTRSEWVKKSNGAYWRANRKGWSKEATKHMRRFKNRYG